MKRTPPVHLPLLAATVLCFTACAPVVPRRVPFNQADFAAYRGPATATVTGQLVVSTRDGPQEGHGSNVELVPINAYTEEMVEMELGRGLLLAPSVDARFKKYARIVTTDSHGNFSIPAVPAGRYCICGEVDWLPPASDDYSGQWAMERINVARGQTLHVTLTHNPNHGHIMEMVQTLR